MPDPIKVIVITPEGASGSVDVSVESLRELILKNPDAFLEAFKSAFQKTAEAPVGRAAGAPTAQATVELPPLPSGPLPMDTPVFKMLEHAPAQMLSPKAAKLAKADLVALATHQKTPDELHLVVSDMRSLQNAFNTETQIFLGVDGGDGPIDPTGIKCCCCTPACCCTAASVIHPIRGVA